MDCELASETLSDFYFGQTDPDIGALLDAHLLECRACLGEFLAFKRDVELGSMSAELPPSRIRARLKTAVIQRLPGPAAMARARRHRHRAAQVAFVALCMLGASALVREHLPRASSRGSLASTRATETADTGLAHAVSAGLF